MTGESPTITDRLWRGMRPAAWQVMLFSFVLNMLMLALPIYSLQVLDRVMVSHSLETLLMLTVIASLCVVMFWYLSVVRDRLLLSMRHHVDVQLSGTLMYRHVDAAQELRPSAVLGDLETLKNFLTGPALKSLCDAPYTVIFLLVLYLIHPVLAVFTLLSGMIILGLAMWNEKATRKGQEEVQVRQQYTTRQLDRFTDNRASIHAMRMQSTLKQRWQEAHTHKTGLQEHMQIRSAWIQHGTKGLRMLIQMLITCIGGYLTLQAEMTVGGMIAGSILAGRALAPFETLISTWVQVIHTRSAYHRLNAYVALPEAPKAMELPTPEGSILLEDVSFTYPHATKPVLHDIRFTLNPGEVLVIIGKSGSGKSTLASLIAGIHKPSHGCVRLDGADISQMTGSETGQHIGYVSENVELFDGTVKENIARMQGSAEDAAVIEAAQLTDTHAMILQLPDGYHTRIGEGGMQLSAGQKQRIALARALYGKPKLLVLDEPNAHLDEAGEAAFIRAMTHAKQQKITTVIITHKPTTLDISDKLLVLVEGSVQQFGTTEKIKAHVTRRHNR